MYALNLSEFYRLRDGAGLPAAEAGEAGYDTLAFAAAHVRLRADGLVTVTCGVCTARPACGCSNACRD